MGTANPQQVGIHILDVHKVFDARYSTIRDWGKPLAPAKPVLRGVSLEVRARAITGLIGQNGSGKSTLLKILAKIFRADRGSIRVRGKLLALLGTEGAFLPDMSLEEAVHLQAALFLETPSGPEVQRILEFASLPVSEKHYVRTLSAGSRARLVVSTALHCQWDSLLVDETLASLDTAFLLKVQAHLRGLADLGKAVLIVSHDLEWVARFCDWAVWLEKGKVLEEGPAAEVVLRRLGTLLHVPQGAEPKGTEIIEETTL